MRNPFEKPAAVARHLKIAVAGKPGKGKTVFGLDARNHGLGPVAVISNEAGDVHYIDHPKWGGFDRLATSSLSQIDEALKYLEAHPGAYGTLVIDTVTGFYEALVSAMAKADGSVNVKSWGLIKRKWRSVMARLNNLPCSIVAVVHENDITETDEKTGKVSVVGQKLDAEKTFERNPDVLIRLGESNGKRVGIVVKDRTGTFQAGARIEEPHIGLWAKSVRAGTAEARVAPPEEVDEQNESAMTGARAESATADEGEPPARQVVIPISNGDGLKAVLAAIEGHGPFPAKDKADEFWKTHWPQIGHLAPAEQKVVRRALDVKVKADAHA